ncbi:MAG: hypothetical protein ACJ795_21275 [Ktedonobacteraceae bacterium]
MKRFFSLIAQLVILGIIFILVLSMLSPFLPFIFQLLLLGLIILLIWALLSPFESLGWWAGWSDRSASQDTIAAALQQTERAGINHYIVYLSGIGAISGDFLYPEEIAFLETVAARAPYVAIVKDVFPYAMNNNGLTGQRFFTWLWRWIKKLNLEGRKLLTNLINIRNLFQVAVSADKRYGPIYNYGAAEVIRDGLLRQGYHIGRGIPVLSLVGFLGSPERSRKRGEKEEQDELFCYDEKNIRDSSEQEKEHVLPRSIIAMGTNGVNPFSGLEPPTSQSASVVEFWDGSREIMWHHHGVCRLGDPTGV